jgi:ATP-dependent exoDNAse (exonuclease V) beta subunit
VTRKENAATETAALIIPAVGNNKLRHESLQRFMLATDSVTVAVEIPIWLTEADIAALEEQYRIELAPRDGDRPRSITGHLDFLQVRNGAVHILDYKPDARTNTPIAQLTIYALALTRLASSPSTSNARGLTSTSTTNFSRARFSCGADDPMRGCRHGLRSRRT